MTRKIDRALFPDEIREIADECKARDNISSTPPEEWRAVAEGDGWRLFKIDTLPDMFALLSAGEPFILDREEVAAQLGEADAIAAGYGPIRATDAGEYELVAIIHDDGARDDSINLYIGQAAAADGHHDLIASDNASMWVVGNEDDHELNRDQWDAIAARCDVAPILAEVRKVDADLADWLAARYEESKRGSIGDRFPPCHNPELRWIPGDYDSIHIESGLSPLSDGEETVCKFMGVDDFCDRAGDCSPETILTDDEWRAVLKYLAEG